MLSQPKCLFVGGTASHAGKSWMTTAICRFLRNRGIRVAPFKAQNMSNNSAPVSGGEIGRAQAVQAQACGVEPVTDMNPILLKPHSDTGSQVVLHGRVWRDLSARSYYDEFDYLLGEALAAFYRLKWEYEFIVIEGAGSVVEVNLQSRDLVNFGFARRVGAPAMLVADIDRGGVFASLIGTMCLLDEQDQKLVRSFAINRFRGDSTLFSDGVTFLEEHIQQRCMGVFPFAHGLKIEAEDGVSLDGESATASSVAVIKLPRISNFTDFDSLHVQWIDGPDARLYDHVILPGTKNTTGDLDWLRGRHLDVWIRRQHAAGAMIIGVCGGYQMLGDSIEENGRFHNGLGMLPVRTLMRQDKTVRSVRAQTAAGHEFEAYEIHNGVTAAALDMLPFAYVDGKPEGSRTGRCLGTYLHGAFTDSEVCRDVGLNFVASASRDERYDALANWFESNADIKLFEELYL
jgi:adenosylcobyric acid synthase